MARALTITVSEIIFNKHQKLYKIRNNQSNDKHKQKRIHALMHIVASTKYPSCLDGRLHSLNSLFKHYFTLPVEYFCDDMFLL